MPFGMPSSGRKSPNILIVEGQDDRHVIAHLFDRAEDKFNIDVKEEEGFPNLERAIPSYVSERERTSLGIVFDADAEPAEKWKTVRNRLREAYSETQCAADYRHISEMEMRAGGIVIPGSPEFRVPRVGVWMMPDNGSPGELEDFVRSMVPEGDAVFPAAAAYIDGIPESERKFAPQKTPKAQLHAWLAARREPGRMGAAIRAGDLSIEGENVALFLDWLRRVFPPEGAASA